MAFRREYVQIKKKILEIMTLEEGDKELLESLFTYCKVDKGVLLIESGMHVPNVFFIISGYLRYYKIMDSGEELVVHLYSPNEFATSLSGFFGGVLSEEMLQTITSCEVLVISKENLEKLYASDPKWLYFGRKLMEKYLMEKEQRIVDQLFLTGQQRYLKLLEQHSDIISNVPIKYLASYLGLQPESLSRIRNKI